MVSENGCGPDSKLRASPRTDAVAHREDGIEVVEPHAAPNPTGTLHLNYRGILGSCRLVELPFEVDVSEV
jgi:hypothetical protein